jgi:hypothetical protein
MLMRCTNPKCDAQLDPSYNSFVIDTDEYSTVKAFECPGCGDEVCL